MLFNTQLIFATQLKENSSSLLTIFKIKWYKIKFCFN